MSLLPRIAGLPRAYWFLWVGALINRIGAFVVPFLALYLTQVRHLNDATAGFIVSLWGAGALLAAPIGGTLADRWGRRPTLILALTSGAAAMLTLGFARTIPQIMVGTLLLGLFGEMYRPSLQAATADLVPPAERTRAFGYLYWAANLGFAIAPVLAGWMAQRSFTVLFVGDAATTLVFAGVVYAAVPETHPGGATRHRAQVGRSMAPYTDGVFLGFVLISFLLALVFTQHLAALPLDMSAHGLDAAAYGSIIFINGALIVLVQPSAATWLQRFPRARVLAMGTFLVGAGFGLNALAHTRAGYSASIVVWSLGEIAVLPVASTVVVDLAPESLRGSYQGAYQLAWGAALFISPSLSGLILARFGNHVLWGGCFLIGIAVSLGHLAIAPARRRRAALLARAA